LAILIALIIYPKSHPKPRLHLSEAFVFSILCCVTSLFVTFTLIFYHLTLPRVSLEAVFGSGEMTPSQRQLVLLVIVDVTYTVFGGFLFRFLENWEFDAAIYYVVVTVTTIGFGDYSPKTEFGRWILIPFSSIGILFTAFTIVSIRGVVLELASYALANAFQRRFGITPIPLNANSNTRGDRSNQPLPSPIFSSIGGSGSAAPLSVRSRYGPSNRYIHFSKSVDDTRNWRFLKPFDEEELEFGSGDEEENMHSSRHHQNQQQPIQQQIQPQPQPHVQFQNQQQQQQQELQRQSSSSLSSSSQSRPSSTSESLLNTTQQRYPSSSLPSRRIQIRTFSHPSFPPLTVPASNHVRRKHLEASTKSVFYRHIFIALCVSLSNWILFGWIFGALEGWGWSSGIYFCFVSITTIGYGDFTPSTRAGRALFLGYTFLGIGALTWLGSLLAEQMMAGWGVEITRIERRVQRHERERIHQEKQKKKKYKEPGVDLENGLLPHHYDDNSINHPHIYDPMNDHHYDITHPTENDCIGHDHENDIHYDISHPSHDHQNDHSDVSLEVSQENIIRGRNRSSSSSSSNRSSSSDSSSGSCGRRNSPEFEENKGDRSSSRAEDDEFLSESINERSSLLP